MKMSMLVSALMVAGVVAVSSNAMAEEHNRAPAPEPQVTHPMPPAPVKNDEHREMRVDIRQSEDRIAMGVKSGKLTPKEEGQLRKELKGLMDAVREVNKDHKITAKCPRSIRSTRHPKSVSAVSPSPLRTSSTRPRRVTTPTSTARVTLTTSRT